METRDTDRVVTQNDARCFFCPQTAAHGFVLGAARSSGRVGSDSGLPHLFLCQGCADLLSKSLVADGPVYSESTVSSEPIFILRAQDRLAPMVVQIWTVLAAAHGAPRKKCTTARDIEMAMLEWQAKNRAKWPD